MLCQRRFEVEFNGLRQFGNTQSYVRSKDKDRSVADRMRESRLHYGKPEDIPKTGERNSFCTAVRSVESAVSENDQREEDRSLIFV